jgi:hypothetical protein
LSPSPRSKGIPYNSISHTGPKQYYKIRKKDTKIQKSIRWKLINRRGVGSDHLKQCIGLPFGVKSPIMGGSFQARCLNGGNGSRKSHFSPPASRKWMTIPLVSAQLEEKTKSMEGQKQLLQFKLRVNGQRNARTAYLAALPSDLPAPARLRVYLVAGT